MGGRGGRVVVSKKQLDQRIEKLFKILENCEICPKKCRVNRSIGKRGFCQLGELPVVSARSSLQAVTLPVSFVRIMRFPN